MFYAFLQQSLWRVKPEGSVGCDNHQDPAIVLVVGWVEVGSSESEWYEQIWRESKWVPRSQVLAQATVARILKVL